jgi:hypothetical protein
VSEFTVKRIGCLHPSDATVAWLKLSPMMITAVPTGPLIGEKLRIFGVTRNSRLLVRVPLFC